MTLTDPETRPRDDAHPAGRDALGRPGTGSAGVALGTSAAARPSWFLPAPAGRPAVSAPTPAVARTAAEPATTSGAHRHVRPAGAPAPQVAAPYAGSANPPAPGSRRAARLAAQAAARPTALSRVVPAFTPAAPPTSAAAPLAGVPATRTARRAAERAAVAARAAAESARAHATTAVRPGNRRRLAAQGAVLAAVTVATGTFTSLHQQVTVEVDGRAVEVEGFGRTVGAVLASAGIEVADGDLVAPALSAGVADGQDIVVRHAHRVTAEVDGETRTWWTTAATVDDALADLGLRGSDVLTSASRSQSLGRAALTVSTPKTLHLVVDGQVVDGVSSAPTVGAALADIGLVLGEGDQVSVPLDGAAVDGLVVLVTRALSDGEQVVEAVPFEVQQVPDDTMLVGTTKVATPGRAGVRTTTYTREVVGGVVVSRTPVASAVTTAPVAQVEKVGTATAEQLAAVAAEKAAQAAAAAAASAATRTVVAAPGSAQATAHDMVLARGWGEDQFSCLVSLWNKESGWNVTAQNRSSGAYGIPQALPGSKMASAGSDWQTNAATQITWGLGYISARYGTPCSAWSHLQSKNWY